jgi:SAM-dependent methyltransferase
VGPDGALVHGTLACAAPPGCGREYPVIDGLAIVVDDLAGYLREERRVILRRRDLPAWAHELLDLDLDDGDPERRRAQSLAAYAAAYPAPPDPALAGLAAGLPAFLDRCLAAHAPRGAGTRGLDAGAGTGGFTALLARHVDHAVGFELAFDRARRAREDARARGGGRRPWFAVASAEVPPFDAASFDVVTALNVLDAVRHPRRLLAALHRCLRPGGLLVVTTPFTYASARTPLAEQLDEDELLPWLAALGGAPGYEVLEDEPRVPWHLPTGDRHHDVYLVRAIAARKAGGRAAHTP